MMIATSRLLTILPNLCSGRTDLGDIEVSLNALTPVSEPLCAVA
jgi:hypothetical protein